MNVTQERLKTLFTYLPETGEFVRNITTSSRSIKGQVAGCFCKKRNRILISVEEARAIAKKLRIQHHGEFANHG